VPEGEVKNSPTWEGDVAEAEAETRAGQIGGGGSGSPATWAGPCLVCRAGVHTIVQAVFGWSGEHLHRFVIGGTEYGISYPGGPGFRDNARGFEFREVRYRSACYVQDIVTN